MPWRDHRSAQIMGIGKSKNKGKGRAKARTGQRACAFGWTATERDVQMWVAAGAAQLCAAA